MRKMAKKDIDIKFIDPETMEVCCTFNHCVDKFTLDDFEVRKGYKADVVVTAFRVCEECGRRVKAKGDDKKEYEKWLQIMSEKDFDTLDHQTQEKLQRAQIDKK